VPAVQSSHLNDSAAFRTSDDSGVGTVEWEITILPDQLTHSNPVPRLNRFCDESTGREVPE
jgi:hypothetical protein